MISNWVNTARVLKALCDLTFSQDAFYATSREELRNGIRRAVCQFHAGLSGPPVERPPLIRQPFKTMLYVLLAVCFVAIILIGR
jgi:hypothetical protein